jgi:signal transduction histidine kinase
VVVGDAALDDDLAGLVAAVREACVNAAKHSGVDVVAVFVEVGASTVAVFVRDRGVGFVPADVPTDRHGLARSVVGRVERLGGSVVVDTSPGAGTEVHLRLPRRPGAEVGG